MDTDKAQILKELEHEIYECQNSIATLARTEEVSDYLLKNKVLNTLKGKYDLALKDVQNECKHEVWYKISETTDQYEGRTYYKCKCTKCGLVKEDRDRDFTNTVIDTKADFNEVVNILKQMKG